VTIEASNFTRNTVPPVRGFLHQPAQPAAGLVLTHGAGGNCNMPVLVALAEAFAEQGVAVLRCDLPFRQLRPHGPPRGSGADDRAGLRQAIAALRQIVPGKTFVGGQSYGGRQATMLVAEEHDLANGLLILSYPLHPPGKPAQLRTQHLPKITAPALFVQGDKDPFASPAEMEAAVKLIPAATSLLIIENAGHDLGFRRAASHQETVKKIVSAFRQRFLAG